MKMLTATALAIVLLQGSPTLAGGLGDEQMSGSTSATSVSSTVGDAYQTMRPSLSSSEIAAIQYHEPVSSRCQTRAGIFASNPLRPIDTTCVVDGLPGSIVP